VPLSPIFALPRSPRHCNLSREQKFFTMVRLQDINDLVRKGVLTQDGADWLKIAVDPYHDTDVKVSGYPDVTCARSIVKLVKKQMTIAVPNTVAPGANWDCSIYNHPYQRQARGTAAQPGAMITCNIDPLNRMTTTNNADRYLGDFVTAQAGPAGADLTWQAGGAPTLRQVDSMGYQDAVEGSFRVIGAGIEITNTTATLQKQGQITCFRNEYEQTDDEIQRNGGAVIATIGPPVNAAKVYGLPDTEALAYRVPNAVQWDAAEGCYLTTYLPENNPYGTFERKTPVFTDQDVGTIALCLVDANQGHNADDNYDNTFPETLYHHNKISCSGAYFTGLSYQTTLLVTTRVYVEFCPSVKSSMLDLASPCATFDPAALRLYSEIMNTMPPGCRKMDNEAGDWFKGILHVLGNIVGPIATVATSIIPGLQFAAPFVGLATKAVQAASGAVGKPASSNGTVVAGTHRVSQSKGAKGKGKNRELAMVTLPKTTRRR